MGGTSPQATVERLEGQLAAVAYRNRPRVRQDLTSMMPGYAPVGSPWSLAPEVAMHGA